MAAKYGNKTCYDCGIRKPANHMEKVTESYNSGRSDTKLTAGNAAGFLFTDSKTSKRAVKRAILGNNRRSYTRNRTVWKCKDCSGTNDYHRAEVAKDIKKAKKVVLHARNPSMFSPAKIISEEIEKKLEEIVALEGTTGSQTSQDLLEEIVQLCKSAPEKESPPPTPREKYDFEVASEKRIEEYNKKTKEHIERTKEVWSKTDKRFMQLLLSVFTWGFYSLSGIVAFGGVLGILQGELPLSDFPSFVVVGGMLYGLGRLCKKFKQ